MHGIPAKNWICEVSTNGQTYEDLCECVQSNSNTRGGRGCAWLGALIFLSVYDFYNTRKKNWLSDWTLTTTWRLCLHTQSDDMTCLLLIGIPMPEWTFLHDCWVLILSTSESIGHSIFFRLNEANHSIEIASICFSLMGRYNAQPQPELERSWASFSEYFVNFFMASDTLSPNCVLLETTNISYLWSKQHRR